MLLTHNLTRARPHMANTDPLTTHTRPHRKGGRIVNVASMAGTLAKLSSDNLRARFESPKLTVDDVSKLMEEFVAEVQDSTFKKNGVL